MSQGLIGPAHAVVVLSVTQPEGTPQNGKAVATAVAHDGERVTFELVYKSHSISVRLDVPQVTDVRARAVHVPVTVVLWVVVTADAVAAARDVAVLVDVQGVELVSLKAWG